MVSFYTGKEGQSRNKGEAFREGRKGESNKERSGQADALKRGQILLLFTKKCRKVPLLFFLTPYPKLVIGKILWPWLRDYELFPLLLFWDVGLPGPISRPFSLTKKRGSRVTSVRWDIGNALWGRCDGNQWSHCVRGMKSTLQSSTGCFDVRFLKTRRASKEVWLDKKKKKVWKVLSENPSYTALLPALFLKANMCSYNGG